MVKSEGCRFWEGYRAGHTRAKRWLAMLRHISDD